MKRGLSAFAIVFCALTPLITSPAAAQKSGGVLRVYAEDSPASMSIHEEATPIVIQYVM